jgi:hypothetical protein
LALRICKALETLAMLNWDDLRLLLAISRRGSFLQAGEMLGVAASRSRAASRNSKPLSGSRWLNGESMVSG